MDRSPVSQGGFAPGAPQGIAGDEHRAWPFIPTVRAPAPVRHISSAMHIPVQAFFASVSHLVTPAQESMPDIIKYSPARYARSVEMIHRAEQAMGSRYGRHFCPGAPGIECPGATSRGPVTRALIHINTPAMTLTTKRTDGA